MTAARSKGIRPKKAPVRRRRVARHRGQKREVPRIVWGTAAQLTAYCRRDGCTFGISIAHLGGFWHVVGAVTRMALEGPSGDMIDSFLGAHAHQNLGSFGALDGESGALPAARVFLYDAPVPADLCGCEDVGFTPVGPDP